MSDTHRENAILQAIDIIADKKISQASFDKTIKAVVKERKDATTGEYLIKYQDSEFTAYATNSEINYQQGEEVYILIPGNDFMGVKRIIGSSNNKAIEYKDLPISKNLYNKIGTNIISLPQKIKLSSYKALSYIEIPGNFQNTFIKKQKSLYNTNRQALQDNILDNLQQKTGQERKNQKLYEEYLEYLSRIKYLNSQQQILKDQINSLLKQLEKEKQDSKEYEKINKQLNSKEQLLNSIKTEKINKNNWFNNTIKSIKGNDYQYQDYININTEGIKNYVLSGNSLAIGMTVKTTFASTQTGGIYGLIFNLNFKDTSSNEEDAVTTKPYIVSSQNIIGNPYSLTKETFVEALIPPEEIDIINFIGIESIIAFCEGFPVDSSKENIKDIIISELYLSGANSLTDSELNGYLLNIDYSETGNIIDNNTPIVKLKAQLKIKGKVTNQNIDYYWFRENGTIFRGSPKYFGKAGDGWECLNPYLNSNPIPFKQNEFSVYGSSENLPIAATASLQKNTKIRCVAIYENNSFIGDCGVVNQNLQDVVIQSSELINGQNKTIYYLDNGSPTLICKVYQPLSTEEYIPNQGELIFKWSIVPYKGRGENIQSTPIDPQQMAINKQILQDAENMDQESKERYIQTDEYKNALAFVQTEKSSRVENNIYYNFPIASINQSAKICCAVYQGDKYLGTGSIILENRAVSEGLYTLSLEHGTQVFQYDGKGNSPTSNQIEKPLQIQPLNFTLLDNEGKEISHTQIMNNGQIQWIYPNTKTLITTSYNDKQIEKGQYNFTVRGAEDLPLEWNEYNVIKNIDNFKYGIADQYDAKKNINYIWLNIKYKDMIFNAYTDFTFPKDGDPGTNGTDFVTKIAIPHGAERIYVNNSLGENKPSIQAYDDTGNDVGQLVFELYNNSIINQYNPQNLIWQCPLKTGESNSNHSYCSCSSGVIKRQDSKLPELEGTIEDILSIFKNDKPLNIVRAKYIQRDVNYYAECPINYSFVINKNYRLRIAPRTGYKYVVYAEDGTSPNYDNTVPFKIILEKQIQKENNLYWIKEQVGLSFEWDVIGNLDIITDPSDKTQQLIVPKDTFDGNNLTNAIICLVKQTIIEDEQETIRDIGFIHIPIYMILNRYGHQALNDWDGNSIQLNGAGNTILAPQIGAGKKEDDNSFTGVFMGTINGMEDDPNNPNSPTNQSNKDRDRGIESDNYKIGFAGYHQGARTIFLDSKTGKAQFGKQNAGRIILDPQNQIGQRKEDGSIDEENKIDAALIYSGNYPIKDFLTNEETKYDVELVGKKYENDRDNKGLLIDFSTPQIGFGSGNFTVTKEGYITAKGGGHIAGWSILDDQLHYYNEVGMASKNKEVPFKDLLNKNIKDTEGKISDTIAFWAGGVPITNDDNNKTKPENLTDVNFYATHGGYLYSKLGQIAGWDFNSQRLVKDKVGMNSDPENPTYILSKWPDEKTHQAKAFFAGDNNQFYVTHDGYFRSTSGKIATWNINTNVLSNGTVGLGEYQGNYSINHGDDKLSISNVRFWSNNNFAVDSSGKLYSAAGYIGGWEIKETYLKAKNITIDSNGSIKGGNWKDSSSNSGWGITEEGNVYFNGGTIGGIKIDKDRIGSPNGNSWYWYISNDKVYLPNLTVQSDHIEYKAGSGSNGTISGNGVRVSGSSGGSYVQPDQVKVGDKKGDPTLKHKIHEWICEAIGTTQLTIYDGLDIDGQGEFSTKGHKAVIKMDGQDAIFGSNHVYFKKGVHFTKDCVIYNDSTKLTSGYIKFNNDTWIYVHDGLIITAKDKDGKFFNTNSKIKG